MSKWFISGVLLALSSVALPSRVHAQADLPPAQIAVLDGDVSLLRDGQPITAIVNMPVVAGDRLTTTAGRVEVLFPDGVALDLDEGVTLDFTAETRVRLSSGRAILVVPAGTSAARYEIDTPSGAVVTRGPGKYRADATGSPTSARAGSSDGFEGWSDALRAARAAAPTSASAEHLPQELQAYDATLDQSGTWQYAPTYGYVWYPRVESDWRPYYEGSWIVVPQYGWTWVGVHRWQYPTHHYGRWGYANNRWFWIPGRAYAPAWVAWGYADDYVSWCPLGVDSRPVFALTMGYGNPWVGWTVLSKSHFGGRGYVPRYAVPAHQLSTQTAFVVQHAAPVVPRGAAVPAAGGTIAVPRQAPVAPMPSAPV
ncbi:MAG TPA: FecR family protein, partial [Vicinamibacterales bacterium]